MKFADLKSKSALELSELLLQTKKEMFNLRFRKASGDMPNTSRLRQLRRTVARIKTISNYNKEEK